MKNTDKIISMSAMVVAVASIVISVWQGFENRNHNRLAVRPRLEISYTIQDSSFGFQLKNNGLGPAILTSRSIIIDGNEYEWYSADKLFEVSDSLGLNVVSLSTLSCETTIPTGTVINLIFFKSSTVSGIKARNKIFEKLSFKIEYKSMYDEMFNSYSSNYNRKKK